MTNIFLIGFMGSGKTTFGKKLAKDLKMNFIDLDLLISTKENMSIQSIFELKGESFFRNLESDYLNMIAKSNTNTVFSLGGGTPCFNSNMNIIKEHGKSVYLHMPVGMLKDRLLNAKTNRPLITPLKDDPEALESYVTNLLEDREPIYRQADLILQDYWRDKLESTAQIDALR